MRRSVHVIDDEIKVLVEQNLALPAYQLPCDQVGVHPENRSRFGVRGTEARQGCVRRLHFIAVRLSGLREALHRLR